MTPAEAAIVLARASGVDGRKHGEAQARVWADVLGNIDLPDAIRAVDEHYATNEHWLYPVHVITGAKRIRDARIGALRAAERQAQIERENAGELQARPVAVLGAGRPLPPETLEDRAARRAVLAKAAHTKHEATVAEVAARAVDAERRAAALAELASHPGREGSVEALTTAAPDGWSQQNPDSEEETA